MKLSGYAIQCNLTGRWVFQEMSGQHGTTSTWNYKCVIKSLFIRQTYSYIFRELPNEKGYTLFELREGTVNNAKYLKKASHIQVNGKYTQDFYPIEKVLGPSFFLTDKTNWAVFKTGDEKPTYVPYGTRQSFLVPIKPSWVKKLVNIIFWF